MPSFPTNAPTRASLDAQFELLAEMTRRSCAAMRSVSELHLQFAQQLLQDAADSSRHMLASTDVFQLAAATALASGPAAEHLHDFQHQLLGLVNGVLRDTRSGHAP